MSQESKLKFDEIGYWSEMKLDIIRDYASEYSKILTAWKTPKLYHLTSMPLPAQESTFLASPETLRPEAL